MKDSSERRHFAAMAMQALASGIAGGGPEVVHSFSMVLLQKGLDEYEYIAKDAVKYADALIAELGRTED